MTLKKKIGWTAGILLVLIAGICIGGSLYLIDFSLRSEIRGKNMEVSEAFMRTEYPQIVPWLGSLHQPHALRDAFITAPDGIRMHACIARASRHRQGRGRLRRVRRPVWPCTHHAGEPQRRHRACPPRWTLPGAAELAEELAEGD